MKPFFETSCLLFECTGCGHCCLGGPDSYVALTMIEAEAIRNHLGLSERWFRKRYLERDGDGNLVLSGISKVGGRCPFLGKDGGCRVYPVRPVQCRTYPYWPEIVDDSGTWNLEARDCEGIGRGGVVSRAHIRAERERSLV